MGVGFLFGGGGVVKILVASTRTVDCYVSNYINRYGDRRVLERATLLAAIVKVKESRFFGKTGFLGFPKNRVFEVFPLPLNLSRQLTPVPL